jgi:hypothetical protein
LTADNVYGKLLFSLSLRAMQNSFVARACLGCIRTEASLPFKRRIFSRLMWGMLTGDEPYRDLCWLAIRPRTLVSLGREMLRIATQRPG